MNNRYRLFIDFDGTITDQDVGYNLFRHFTNAATEPVVQLYRDGRINSLACLSRECEIWNDSAPNHDDVLEYLYMQRLSPGFMEFLDYLREIQLQPQILSEGFDFYIDPILSSYGLQGLEKITNRAVFSQGHLEPLFPYFEQGCGQCSNCKGYHITGLRSPNVSAIYIGDGHSDLHASRAADIVFAKSHLRELLVSENRYFIDYENFFDILEKLDIIVNMDVFAQNNNIRFCRIQERRHNSIRTLWECGEVMRHVGYPQGLGWSPQQYESYWSRHGRDVEMIHLAVEDPNGIFLGEARIGFPDNDNFCQHDLKLMPQFQHRGLGRQAWQMILQLADARWPGANALVTPSARNDAAINLYLKLGFQFDGGPLEWNGDSSIPNAVPLEYRRMVKRAD